MRNAIIYDKIRDFEQCVPKRQLKQDTIQLLKFIDKKQRFSVIDDSFIPIRTKTPSKLDHAIQTAVKIGMIKPQKPESTIPTWFKELNSISYWQKQLRGSMFRNLDSKSGTTTRKTYLQMVWHFNKWLCKKEFQLKKTIPVDADTFKQELRTIKFTNIEEMLSLLSEPFSPRVEIIKIIKTYLLDESHAIKSKSYMIVIASAIKSYFEKNEYPLDIKYKCNTEQPEDLQNMTLSDVMTLLTNGKPSILEKAVFMCKFHRGLDASTLVDRFNYEAWIQIVKWFGSENPDSWDLEKCPVPIKLVRVKTNFLHVGFLDRDAIESIQKYVKYKSKKHSSANIGTPLFVNKFGRPISLGWVFEKFARIAENAGLRIPTGRKGQYVVDSHELRDLLKSTLIDSGCNEYVADHVIGHKPKDSYEKQTKLYPETLRREYSKASKRLNIFTKFTSVVNGIDDSDSLKAELNDALAKLKQKESEENSRESALQRHELILKQQNEKAEETQKKLNELQEQITNLNIDSHSKPMEFCCADCSIIHTKEQCPNCGSKIRRIYDSKP